MRLKTIFWVIAWLIVLAGVSLLVTLRSYRVFTEEELVAIVWCEPAPPSTSYKFTLRYAPVTKGVVGTAQRFPMYGDQWMISGDILKWHPGLNLLGIRSCQKLTRLNSRYLRSQMELKSPKTAYDLNDGTNFFWRWMYPYGRRIPFVEAVYGNSAYVMAQPGARFGVYATLSGYLVKPIREGTAS